MFICEDHVVVVWEEKSGFFQEIRLELVGLLQKMKLGYADGVGHACCTYGSMVMGSIAMPMENHRPEAASQPRLLGYTYVRMRSQCLKLNFNWQIPKCDGWFIIYVPA